MNKYIVSVLIQINSKSISTVYETFDKIKTAFEKDGFSGFDESETLTTTFSNWHTLVKRLQFETDENLEIKESNNSDYNLNHTSAITIRNLKSFHKFENLFNLKDTFSEIHIIFEEEERGASK